MAWNVPVQAIASVITPARSRMTFDTALSGFAIAANGQAASSALLTERPDCYLPR